jgi:hypothetical protein
MTNGIGIKHQRYLRAIIGLFVAFLAGCDVDRTPEGQTEPQAEARTSALIEKDSLGFIPTDIRFPRAGVIPVGRWHFALGWFNFGGTLRYAGYGSTGTNEVPAADAGSSGLAYTIRTNTSRPLEAGGCTSLPTRAINYAAVQLGTTVFLDRLSFGNATCGAQTWNPRTRTQIDIDAGAPAVATQGSYSQGRALVVYGKAAELRGRFLEWSTSFSGVRTEALGPSFLIANLPANHGVFSSDVVFDDHPASQSFVIGYLSRAPRDGRVMNVVVSGNTAVFPPTIVRSPIQWGTFDADAGGHYSSAAYTPGSSDGTYAWWTLADGAGKAVRAMSRTGEMTSFPPFSTLQTSYSTNVTVPVTSSWEPSMPYLFLTGDGSIGQGGSNTRIMGMRPDKTFTCLHNCPGVSPADVLRGTPLAIGTLPGVTIALTVAGTGATTEGLMFISNKQVDPPTVAQSKSESPSALNAYSYVSPYQQYWDHVMGDDVGTSHQVLQFDNQWSGVYSGWTASDRTSNVPTAFRTSMWIKDPNLSGSELSIVATDSNGQIWDWNLNRGRVNVTANAWVFAAGSPSGYIRHDGWRIVVYRGTDNYIYEASSLDGLTYSAVNVLPGQSGDALGDPIGYNRGGSSSVVYKCGMDNHTICELRLNGGWGFRKITTAAVMKGSTLPAPAWNHAGERVIFYAGHDGLHAVKDPVDPQMTPPTDVLVVADESIASTPAVFGCATSSTCNDQSGGLNVVYRSDSGADNSIVEMVETPSGSGQWVKQVRYSVAKATETIVGDPAVFVSVGPWLNSIVYGNSAHQYRMLRWNGSSYSKTNIYR